MIYDGCVHRQFQKHLHRSQTPDLGPNFYERNFDGTMQTAFLTTPLWGFGSTAPYGHDGRSINLIQVILRHLSGRSDSKNDEHPIDLAVAYKFTEPQAFLI